VACFEIARNSQNIVTSLARFTLGNLRYGDVADHDRAKVSGGNAWLLLWMCESGGLAVNG